MDDFDSLFKEYFEHVKGLISQRQFAQVREALLALESIEHRMFALQKISLQLLESRDAEFIDALVSEFSGDRWEVLWPAYVRAVLHSWTGDVGPMLTEFLRVKKGIEIFLHQHSNLGHLLPALIFGQVLFYDLTLFHENSQTRRFELPKELPGADPWFVASCNGIYFDQFSQEFMRSALACSAGSKVFVHITGPTPLSHRHAQSYQDLYGHRCHFSFEDDKPISFTAVRRFQVASELLKRGHSVIVSDIDVILKKPCIEMFKLLGTKGDAGCFEIDFTEPLLICHLSISAYRPTASCIAFLETLSDYYSAALELYPMTWTLDQAGLFFLTRLLRAHPEGFKKIEKFAWVDLKSTGYDLLSTQSNQTISDADKFALRAAANKNGTGKRPIREIFQDYIAIRGARLTPGIHGLNFVGH